MWHQRMQINHAHYFPSRNSARKLSKDIRWCWLCGLVNSSSSQTEDEWKLWEQTFISELLRRSIQKHSQEICCYRVVGTSTEKPRSFINKWRVIECADILNEKLNAASFVLSTCSMRQNNSFRWQSFHLQLILEYLIVLLHIYLDLFNI